MATKQLNIENKSYYFYNDLINSYVSINILKLDKKTWKDIAIYYIGYVDKNTPEDWKVNSVNSLYLMINRVFCFVGEKNGVKYLSIDRWRINNMESSFSGIKYHIKKISHECKELTECKGFPECEEFPKCKVDYDDDFNKVKFISNDSVPLGKLIYFPTITVVIRCVIE